MATTEGTSEHEPSGSRTRTRRRRGGTGPALAAVTLATLLLAALLGCSAGSNTSSAGSAGGAASERVAPTPAPAGAAAGAAKDAGAGGAQNRTQTDAALLPRALVRTAELTVRVDDVDKNASRVAEIAHGAGGQLYGDSRYGSGDEAKADIVVKVDPDRMDSVLGQVAALGTEQGRSSSTEDVTEQVADVDSRVATMKASIARVRALLSRANSVGDLVSVEGELTRREADLESLQARQRALAGQVALATVTVHLLARGAPAPPATAEGGFGSGLTRGWHAFAASAGWLLTALGTVLPFAALVLLALLGWRLAVSRTRRPRPAPAAPGPADPAS